MLPVKTIQPYTPQGLFAANRKFDIHTGLDLYCESQSLIRCVSDGYVKEVIDFTGVNTGSPWWHDTQAVVVQCYNGTVMVYGELLPTVQPKQIVTKEKLLGYSRQVLRLDKGVNPPCMLHFELWTSDYQSNFTWHHDQPKPVGLVNPLTLFNFWVIKTPYGYRIETHDGHYWRHFSSAIDCKSYCQWRNEEFNEKYVYLGNNNEQYQNYKESVGHLG